MHENIHTQLINRGIELGYFPPSMPGICHGISLRWFEEMLMHREA